MVQVVTHTSLYITKVQSIDARRIALFCNDMEEKMLLCEIPSVEL